MKSLNKDEALWNRRKQDASAGEVGPNCCWVIGCCWYWLGMASPGADDPEPSSA
jgi:hypothetical protein